MNLDWIAGFVDGEGCFTVNINVYSERYRINRERWYTLHPIIHITQCDRDILCKIQRALGFGHVNSQGTHIAKGVGFRHVYALRIGGWVDCRRFLDLVGPHLVLKKKHVQVMYKMIEAHGENGQGHRITPPKLLTLIDLAKELRLLNARDPADALRRLDAARTLVLERLKDYEEMRPPNGWWDNPAWLSKPFVNKRLKSPKESRDAWLRMTLHLPMQIRRWSFARHDSMLLHKNYVKPQVLRL